jgi:hypothetical protein
MSAFFQARVKETTNTSGTGTLQLLGAPTGYRTFLSAFGNGGNFYYAILDGAGGNAYEYGIGTINASSVLTRGNIINGSAGPGTPVLWGSNTKTVICSITPEACLNNGSETFTDLDTTPDVRGGNVWNVSNSGATTITNFDNEVSGQQLTLVFSNSNTTIQHNASIRLAGGANFVGTANDVLVLINIGGVFYEKCRSVNT